MGFKQIAFTDHCTEKNRIDKRQNMRMEYQEKDKYLNSIKYLKEKYEISLEINFNDIFKKTYYKDKKLNNLPIEEQRKKLKKVIYPCKEFWEIASNYNIKVLYGLDVHHRGQILLFNELVQLANEIIGNEILSKLNFIE